MRKMIVLVLVATVLFCSNALAQEYSTTFPLTENPISEGGNWVGGQTAGDNLWGNCQTNGTMVFGVAQPTEYGDPIAILTGTWGTNQTAQATVKIGTTPTGCCHEVELHLRMAINAATNQITGYEINCNVDIGDYLQVVRWNGPNGSFTYLGTRPDHCVNGDVLTASISGGANDTIINVWKNGSLLQFDTGTNVPDNTGTAFTNGAPGLGFFDYSDSNWNYFGFSNFMATGSGPQPSSPTYTISGTVGVVGATITYTGTTSGSTSSSGSTGTYSITVSSGWSGTVTPTLTGYTFSPTSTTYTDVTSNQTTNYAAIATTSKNYTLTLLKSGTGTGTVTSSPSGNTCRSTCSSSYGSYASGTIVTLSETPDSNSSFLGWSGACSGTGLCSVTMSSAETVTATFNLLTSSKYTLVVKKSGTGSVTVTSSPSGISCGLTCSKAYNSGTVVTLTAYPNWWTVFTGWSGAGCSGTGSCTVAMDANETVTANFRRGR